jgi:hypothetical protein
MLSIKAKLSHNPHTGDKGETKYSSYSFLTLALDGVSVSNMPWLCFTPGKRTPSTHWIGGWVGVRDGLDIYTLSIYKNNTYL